MTLRFESTGADPELKKIAEHLDQVIRGTKKPRIVRVQREDPNHFTFKIVYEESSRG